MRRPPIAPLALIAGLASLAPASPALADTPPVLPVISAVGSVPDDAGYLEFHAAADSAIDPASVTAQLTLRVSGERPVTTVTEFTLISGTPEDGTWRTTDRMALGAHGVYDAVVDLTDADGDHPAYLGQAVVPYEDLPVFSDSRLDRTTVDFEHQFVTATGSVSTFDPATGVTTPSWTGGTVYLEGHRGSGQWEVPTTVQPDGTYQVTGQVDGYVYVYAVQPNVQTVNTEPVLVTRVPNQTRIVFDKATGTAIYGSAYTVSGTVEYLSSTTNTWTPMPGADHDAEVALQGPNGYHAYEFTSGGRFSEKLDTVTGDTTWSALVGGFGYLAQSTAEAHVHALSRSVLIWSDHTFTGAGVVRVKGRLSAPDGPLPTGRVELQQSANGSTGWATVATVAPNATGFFDAWHTLSHPTGYLRLHYSGSANATAAVTSKVHLTRSVTRLTGFNASPEPVRKDGTLTVEGTLQRQNRSSWTSLSGQKVTIYFRAPGAKKGTSMGTITTGKDGKFTAKFTAKRDGTWSATYAATSSYLNTTSISDYVDVR